MIIKGLAVQTYWINNAMIIMQWINNANSPDDLDTFEEKKAIPTFHKTTSLAVMHQYADYDHTRFRWDTHSLKDLDHFYYSDLQIVTLTLHIFLVIFYWYIKSDCKKHSCSEHINQIVLLFFHFFLCFWRFTHHCNLGVYRLTSLSLRLYKCLHSGCSNTVHIQYIYIIINDCATKIILF